MSDHLARVAVLLGAATLAACNDTVPLVRPELSPIGSGLNVTRTALPTTAITLRPEVPGSLYGRRTRELLTDVRASEVGDTVTVIIQLDDEAKFDNRSERERSADTNFEFDLFGSGRGFDGPEGSGELNADGSLASTSKYKGTGAIDRSERLSLRVAGVVTEVLLNGNLIIAGRQEIRVNDEVRILDLAGIVNPLDVTRDNTIDYGKMAEARISYGGRGRQSEVQSPNWGQQIYDRVVPF